MHTQTNKQFHNTESVQIECKLRHSNIDESKFVTKAKKSRKENKNIPKNNKCTPCPFCSFSLLYSSVYAVFVIIRVMIVDVDACPEY